MDLSGISNKVGGSFSFNLPGGLVFQPSYFQAGLMIFLIFLLILTLGSLRHRMNEWAIKGIMPGVMFGFVLAILLEGILLIGGKTVLTEVLGWKNAPKPIANALEEGRSKLVNVLGAQDSKEGQVEEEIDPEIFLKYFNMLTPSEAKSITSLICTE